MGALLVISQILFPIQDEEKEKGYYKSSDHRTLVQVIFQREVHPGHPFLIILFIHYSPFQSLN